MWGKIMIPMYRLWLHGLYGLYGPCCPMSAERLLNLITHSLTWQGARVWKDLFFLGWGSKVNPCHAEFILGNTKIYLNFLLFRNTEMAQVVEILPHEKQGPVNSVYSIPSLLMAWRLEGPKHQDPQFIGNILVSVPEGWKIITKLGAKKCMLVNPCNKYSSVLFIATMVIPHHRQVNLMGALTFCVLLLLLLLSSLLFLLSLSLSWPVFQTKIFP